VDIVLQKSKVEDYKQILLWLTHSLGWTCDPGNKTNTYNAQTQQAVSAFQVQYNTRFSAGLPTHGKVDRETWGAFFDVYMEELKHLMGTDEAGLKEVRKALSFLSCARIGCGENFPITPNRRANYKTPIDRRVEVLFFDPGEEPRMDCHAGGTCQPDQCELYDGTTYDFHYITPTPGPTPTPAPQDDTTPPAVTPPPDLQITVGSGVDSVPATDPAIVAFLAAASAIDDIDGQLPVSSDAPATFSMGATWVTFTATDSAGNTGAATAKLVINRSG